MGRLLKKDSWVKVDTYSRGQDKMERIRGGLYQKTNQERIKDNCHYKCLMVEFLLVNRFKEKNCLKSSAIKSYK